MTNPKYLSLERLDLSKHYLMILLTVYYLGRVFVGLDFFLEYYKKKMEEIKEALWNRKKKPARRS